MENTQFAQEELNQLSTQELVEIILIQQNIIQHLKQKIELLNNS